jgi:hypothetical protein
MHIVGKVFEEDLVNLLACETLVSFINKSNEYIEEFLDRNGLRTSLEPVVYTYTAQELSEVKEYPGHIVLGLNTDLVRITDTIKTITNIKKCAGNNRDVVQIKQLVITKEK